MPLLWAHSEYVKLHRSVADGQVFDLVEAAHVANARMQSKIYKILSPDQKKKLSDLERTQGAVTSDSR
jgi:hypothetical protein